MKKLTFLLGVIISLFQIHVYAEEYPEIVLLDCENINGIHYRFRPISDQTLHIVDNPLKDDVNRSEKVMQINPSLASRCILNIDLIRNQEPEDMYFVEGYTNIKLKYYSPNVRGNEMLMQYDAREEYPDYYYPEGGKWEEIDFEFPYDDMEWELLQLFFNANSSWQGTDSLQNLIYVDDIIIYSTNNTSSIHNPSSTDSFTGSISQQSGGTVLTLSASQPENITAELYSVTGKSVGTLYQGIVGSPVEIPVKGGPAGIYLIRITDGKGESQTLKTVIK
ncbi:MAG: T9SS type A sorting domain-containing protein [Candidatus Azobacteroides sp.]|nr:T9SS type A sorting domain-containing protein [Candidatus Azobacteroides sp.]